MNDGGDYAVRKAGAGREIGSVGRATDQPPDARTRDRAKRNAKRKARGKLRRPADPAEGEPETDAPPDAGDPDDGHTVDHLA